MKEIVQLLEQRNEINKKLNALKNEVHVCGAYYVGEVHIHSNIEKLADYLGAELKLQEETNALNRQVYFVHNGIYYFELRKEK